MMGLASIAAFLATFWAPWPMSEMTLTTLTTAGTKPDEEELGSDRG